MLATTRGGHARAEQKSGQNPVVTGAMESTSPDLSEVASMLEDMQKGIQQLHDEDATLYEKEACHCEEETAKLAEVGKGTIPLVIQESSFGLQSNQFLFCDY